MKPKTLIKALERGNVKRVLKKCDWPGWQKYIERTAAIPSCNKLVLRLQINSKDGPWYLWAEWKMLEADTDKVTVMLEGFYVPNEDLLMDTPEELENEPFFAGTCR